MDTSDNMDSLDDSPVLPELSFDDLLDPSPIKKNNKSSFDDDDDFDMELSNERKKRLDDSLNTPGPKKPTAMQKHLNSSVYSLSGSRITTPIRAQAVKLGNSPSTSTSATKSNSGASPVLLNSKNILPKSSNQILNNSIKLTQKIGGGNLSLSGKTAVRTSNGQIIYIQKAPSTSNIKTSTTSTLVKSSSNNAAKPVTIQVLRTADGSYIPIKTTTSSTNVKSTLTLSPSTLAGKKIISSTGGQVIIKGTIKPSDSTLIASSAKTITTNSITGVRTVVKPISHSSLTTGQIVDLNKSKSIVMQGTSGKQIIVSSQNIVKLSPKPQAISTSAGGNTLTTSTTASGQIHAIQIPGKIGVQYVRVLPNTKVPAKNVTSSAGSSVTSTGTLISTKTPNTLKQPIKILNPLPQKFTVVQKGAATKLIVTQKKDISSSNTGPDFPPRLQKTIVTVPTVKPLTDDKIKNTQTQLHQQSLIKSTQNNLMSSNSNTRKHKIAEINSEIQKITTTADNAGPSENKKSVPNNRVVVLANNSQPKILNNSLQQPGRVTTSVSLTTNTSSASKSASGSMVQVVNVTQNGNKLFTVLKPSSVEQKANPKLYSVLKTSNQYTPTSSTITTSTTNKDVMKPLINKQQLIHQQQKLAQLQKLEKQQQNETSQKTATSLKAATTTYLLPIKIKEEPEDTTPKERPPKVTTTNNAEAAAAQQNVALPLEDDNESLDPLVGGVRRKHCNCSKSQCLKLYCDCFANGEFCQNCTCKDCLNNLENEDERQRAIKSCLERNPSAFKPKITSSRDQGDMRLHNKGCNCKRSGCLKNYCECYEAKIPCSSNCKCVGCRNVEDRPDLDMDPIDPKIMASISMGGTTDNAGLKRSYEKSQRDLVGSGSGVAIKTEKLSKEQTKASNDALGGSASPILDRQQCNFITQEVIDATIQCMITQADECEKNSLPAYQTEKMVMEELGRCLVEIIDFSIRNTDNSYSQD